MGRLGTELERTREAAPAVATQQSNMNLMANPFITPAVSREVATVVSQMSVALSNPRHMPTVYYQLDQICAGERLATQAVYAYAKGGTSVSGPSIRLAEAVARAYRNVKYGFEVVDADESGNTVRSYAFDMESNTQAERIFRVPNIRHTRAGDTLLTDPREIYENVANNASRRVRACILEIIPPDVIDYAVDACTRTVQAKVDTSPENVGKMIKAFEAYGVTKAMIEDFIQRKIEAIAPTQFIRLREIYSSLRDGIASVDDFFKSNTVPTSEQNETPQTEVKVEPVQETVKQENPVAVDGQKGPEDWDDTEDLF